MVQFATASNGYTMMLNAAFLRLLLWLAELVLLPSQKIWDGPGTSWDWLRIFGAQGCQAGVLSSILFWLGTASAASALCWMTGELLIYFSLIYFLQMHFRAGRNGFLDQILPCLYAAVPIMHVLYTCASLPVHNDETLYPMCATSAV